MATVKDFTDPKGTKYPNKNLILVSTHIFKSIIIIKRSLKIYFPLNIYLNNIYGIFSLFFINDILDILTKNINKYGTLYYQHLKTSWKNILVTKLRAFLKILIYYFLYL